MSSPASPPAAAPRRIPPLIATFRWVAYAEAASFLALLVATFVKRVLEGPEVVSILGPIHGILFLVYVAMVLQVRPSQGWNLGRTLLVIIASALPFGGFFVGMHLVDDTDTATEG